MKRYYILLFAMVFFVPEFLFSQEEEKYKEAIYRESDVPEYELPELLKSFNGKKITNVHQWEHIRKPEILKFFAENLFGEVPDPQYPIQKEFKVVKVDSTYLDGLCTRKDIIITHSNKLGKVDLPMVMFVPNLLKGPFPAIYWMQTNDIENQKFDLENPQRYGFTRNGAPLKQLMLRGIALISLDCSSFVDPGLRQADKLSGGICDLYFHDGQTTPKDNEWGMMAAWSHAMISGMDYIVTDHDIKKKEVAVMGCSIGGKVAIWAAAQDERIGMILSATAGHGGDALWHRQVGETLDNMCKWLPRWPCVNAQKYAADINKMPVDQHMLLACLAPRPLYVSNAIYDYWADNKGEWLGTYHAAPAYKLYGKDVRFESEEQPEVNNPIIKSAIGYHVRSGFHGLKLYDWERFMEFIEYHFNNKQIKTVHDVYYPNGKLFKHYPNMLQEKHLIK